MVRRKVYPRDPRGSSWGKSTGSHWVLDLLVGVEETGTSNPSRGCKGLGITGTCVLLILSWSRFGVLWSTSPWILSSLLYGSCTVRVWFLYDSCMVRVRFMYSSCVVRVRFICSSRTVHVRLMCGSCTVRVWFMYSSYVVHVRFVFQQKST